MLSRRHVAGSLTAALLLACAAPACAQAVSAPGRQAVSAPGRQAVSAPGRQAVSEVPGPKFGLPAPKPRPKGTVRIATYNMLNLFDHDDDPKLSGDIEDMDLAVSDARCRAMAAAIRAVDADIIALQEIESYAALEAFRDTYLSDLGYTHIASKDVGYYRGPECSVLSRFPIKNVKIWPQDPLGDVRREGPGWSEYPADEAAKLTFRRSPLRVDIQVTEDYELTLFVMHHKSGSPFRWQREMEAIRTMERVKEVERRDPSRNVIVLGDFNAAPWDKSLRHYLERGMIDTLAHRIIPRWKDADETEPNLFKTHESGRTIDYILLNSAAYREYVTGSAHVVGTLYDPNYDWKNDPYPDGYAADHYPVVIDLVPRDVK